MKKMALLFVLSLLAISFVSAQDTTVVIQNNADSIEFDSLAVNNYEVALDTANPFLEEKKEKTKFRIVSLSIGGSAIVDADAANTDVAANNNLICAHGNNAEILIRPTKWIGIGAFCGEYRYYYDNGNTDPLEYLSDYYGEYEIGGNDFIATGPVISIMPFTWISITGRYHFYSDGSEGFYFENKLNYYSAGIRLETPSKWAIGIYTEGGANFSQIGETLGGDDYETFYLNTGITINLGKVKKK